MFQYFFFMFEDECMNELGTIMVYVSYNQWPNDPSDKNGFGRLENKSWIFFESSGVSTTVDCEPLSKWNHQRHHRRGTWGLSVIPADYPPSRSLKWLKSFDFALLMHGRKLQRGRCSGIRVWVKTWRVCQKEHWELMGTWLKTNNHPTAIALFPDSLWPEAGVYIPASMNHGKVVYKKQERSRGAIMVGSGWQRFFGRIMYVWEMKLVAHRYLHLFDIYSRCKLYICTIMVLYHSLSSPLGYPDM
jgi:hypothetical protein